MMDLQHGADNQSKDYWINLNKTQAGKIDNLDFAFSVQINQDF